MKYESLSFVMDAELKHAHQYSYFLQLELINYLLNRGFGPTISCRMSAYPFPLMQVLSLPQQFY